MSTGIEIHAPGGRLEISAGGAVGSVVINTDDLRTAEALAHALVSEALLRALSAAASEDGEG